MSRTGENIYKRKDGRWEGRYIKSYTAVGKAKYGFVYSINDISKDTADKLQHEYQRFVKGLIWFYEKETRIQVEITNTKLLDTAKSYVVALKLDNIYEDLLVRLAPELGEINADFFDEYDGIRDWAYTKLQKSDFSGQLKMDLKSKLCRECNKSEKDK